MPTAGVLSSADNPEGVSGSPWKFNAGFRPGRRPTFVSAKVGKTIDAPPGLIGLIGRAEGETGQLAGLTQARQEQERPIMGRAAGVGPLN